MATTVEERLRLLEERMAELELRLGREHPDVTTSGGMKNQEADKNLKTDRKSSSRARVVLSKWDDKTKSRSDYDLSELLGDSPNTGKSKDQHEYAILLRKIPGHPGEESDGELEIVGKELQSLLRALLQAYPYHISLGETIELSAPFEPLVLHWDLLEQEASSPGQDDADQLARNDLRLLLNTIKEGSGDAKLDDYLKIRDSLKASQSVTYESLWTIFPPGTLVYSSPFMKYDQIFMVIDHRRTWPVSYNSSRSRGPSQWILDCWTYDWNGESFHRYGIELSIEEFEGPKPISSLSVQPLDTVEKPAEMKEKLFQQGSLFREYCTTSRERRMFQYLGKAILDKEGFRGVYTGTDDLDEDEFGYKHQRQRQRQSHISGDVMVDFESYYKHGPDIAYMGNRAITEDTLECKCGNCTSNQNLQNLYRSHYDGKRGTPDETWEREQTMLLPPRLLGYVLREKQWTQLAVENIMKTSRESPENAFRDTLRLAGEDGGKETKDVLHALIKNHGISESANGQAGYQLDDIVADKGKGLVILLYGPPGVGKTSTAQTIASAADKPLFTIGVADVGTTARLVESNLEKIFDLATTWKAVLLIDEADVFMQSRARGQMGPTTERNALVSVFLRVLEYYQGILILTTNQIAQFDVAVQSRIHIAIRYEGLDKVQTMAIFRGFLTQYKAKKLVQPDMFNKIMNWVDKDLSKKKFDGRQIRNIVTSAMGLACAAEDRDPPGMTINDLQNVVDYMLAFKTDLNYQMKQYLEAQNGNHNPYA